MLADVASGQVLSPECPDAQAASHFIAEKQPDYFSYDDWLKLDALEVANGKAQGRPRVKFTSVADMLTAVGKR